MKQVGAKTKKSRGGFEYKERSADSVKRRAERTGGRFDSPVNSKIDTWRPKVGDNQVRIMPPTWDDHDHYAYQVWVHQYIGPDESNYLCLRRMRGEKCAACDEVGRARAAGEQEEAKRLEPKEQYWCWVVDRDSDDKDPTPMIYMMGWMADRDIAALCHNSRTGKVRHIDHPDEGYDLIVKRTGQGVKTRYQYQIDHDATPLHDDQDVQDKLLEFIQENPVPSTLHFYDNEYLEKMLSGEVKQKDEDEDEEEKPARRRSSRDDADEEEETPVRRRRPADEEDEDEKPARRKPADEVEDEDERPRRRKPAADEEEEEERPARRRKPADEEEEEEKPRRRRSADEDEEEKPARRKPVDDDEEEEKPRRRRPAADEDEEDEKPARRRRTDDDEEEERPRRRKPADEEEEEERPARRRKPADEEEEEERPRRVRTNK